MTGFTPGVTTPAASTPHVSHPGPRQPGERTTEVKTVAASGVAVDAAGSTVVGIPSGYDGEIVEVRVDATESDFNFNIDTGDVTAVFDSTQSPGSTSVESFAPDTEDSEFDGNPGEIDFRVSSASATGGATADVYVDVAVERR